MRKSYKVLLIVFLVFFVTGCVGNESSSAQNTNIDKDTDKQVSNEVVNAKINYQADTSLIKSELEAKGYKVHNVDFTKNKNGYYVITAMIDTKGNYDTEILNSYKAMYKNGVADYYLVVITDYEINTATSYTVKKKTLDNYLSGKITDNEYIQQVDAEIIL